MSCPIRGKVQPFQLAARSCAASPLGGILLVGGARGLHLLDRSSNRRASWETPTPGRETKCTFNMRTKKCVSAEEKEQLVKCQRAKQ